MKKLFLTIAFISTVITFTFGQTVPKSVDLRETDKFQRRDLSMPMSRVLINFFDFKSPLSTSDYSNRYTLPLNIAYLTTDKNEPGAKAINRFSRSVTDLLTIHKTSKGVDGLIQDFTVGTASKYSTVWMPHALPFTAEYENGSAINGVDFLYDLKTVVRKIEFKGDAKGYCFAGNWGGVVKFEKNTIIVENNNLRYAIAFSFPVTNYRTTTKKWYVSLDNLKNNNKLIISVSFADKSEAQTALIERALAPIQKNDNDQQDKAQAHETLLVRARPCGRALMK